MSCKKSLKLKLVSNNKLKFLNEVIIFKINYAQGRIR